MLKAKLLKPPSFTGPANYRDFAEKPAPGRLYEHSRVLDLRKYTDRFATYVAGIRRIFWDCFRK